MTHFFCRGLMLFLLVCFGVQSLQAQPVIIERVIAVINDQILTLSDLKTRLKFTFIITQLPDTPQNRQRLQTQAIRSLITETLQIQEAERLNLLIQEAEIQERFNELARLNSISPEQFESELRHFGVLNTVKHKIRADLSWGKVIRNRIHPQVRIPEEEITHHLEQIKLHQNTPRFLVSIILLRPDENSSLESLQQDAQTFVSQIRQGASFSGIARQFSDDTGAVQNAGDLGWIREDQISPELYQILKTMKVNEISAPIETTDGIYILYLRDKRIGTTDLSEIRMTLQKMVWPYQSTDEKERHLTDLQQIQTETSTCTDLTQRFQNHSNVTIENLGTVPLETLDSAIQILVTPLTSGQISSPVVSQDTVSVWVVCERFDPPDSLPDREQIALQLGNQRISILQHRYLLQIQRNAFIDIRL